MSKSLREFRIEFAKSIDDVADISKFGDVPDELKDEDVYDCYLLFRDENIALNYIVDKYNMDKDTIIQELYEDESFREEYGRKKYLRSAHVSYALYINELLDGTYILWKAF